LSFDNHLPFVISCGRDKRPTGAGPAAPGAKDFAMSLTPMLQQYQALRKTLSADTILFFRLGDFYEMFFEDAHRASSILDITLTARDGGSNNRVPMCGVPYHAAQGYINRLTRTGLKVAICEQVEDPKLARGIVRREIVRIVSPGTNLEDDADESGQCVYIASFHAAHKRWGCAYLDLGTGEFRLGEHASAKDLEDELMRLRPRECVISQRCDRSLLNIFFREHQPTVNEYEDWIFEPEGGRTRILEHFQAASLASFGIEDLVAGIACAGALLYYLRDNLHTSLGHLKKPRALQASRHMQLDKHTIRNLDIARDSGASRGTPTLYDILNRTVTPMGARLLRQWITRPLIDPGLIRMRLDAVDELLSAPAALRTLRERLASIRDIERLLARINCGTPSARDAVAMGVSLKALPEIRRILAGLHRPLLAHQHAELHELRIIPETVERAFVDLPPPGIRDGGFIRDGYNAELDELRSISTRAREWIAELQHREIAATGIKSLKIKYNKVFGYHIEVTRANTHMVPERYIRRQTLVNAERFVIPELKEYEEKILGAEDRAHQVEYDLFEEVRTLILSHTAAIQSSAQALAVIDTLCAFAAVALNGNYCKPDMTDDSVIYLAGSRHPVVEQALEGEPFIDNDVQLDATDNQLLIITGPNMAGKSTFIRQVALIVLMAQAGSYVPARAASIGVADRVFSRIGAADHLARGESTFMVEMIETASILHNATPRSLLIFDEIGRGTSTFDGVSIAWSVCEYLNRGTFRPRCLFATHYHELTELADHRPGIRNYTVTVKELVDRILFLRKVVPGAADRSYGIHVGKLAGLPQEIIERAEEVLLCLEEEKISEESITEILNRKKGATSVYDLPLFRSLKKTGAQQPAEAADRWRSLIAQPVIEAIQRCDINGMTPLAALMQIEQWKQMLQKAAEDTPAPHGPRAG
jgi:DNA mismatch repair protein MutS